MTTNKQNKLIKSKKFIFVIILLFNLFNCTIAQSYQLNSPNKSIVVEINIGDKLSWTVNLDNSLVIENGTIAMYLNDGRILGKNTQLKKQKIELKKETISVTIPNKDAIIESVYNQLSLDFKGKYAVEFRAYNDGVAYRFVDKNKRTQTVIREAMQLTFPKNTLSYFPKEESMYSHNERAYLVKTYEDGMNVHRNAMDYKIKHQKVNQDSRLNLTLAKGGGFSAIIRKL